MTEDAADVDGAVVLVADPFPRSWSWGDLEQRGARAVICSPGWRSASADVTRRVELRPRSALAAFSVPPPVLRELLTAPDGDEVSLAVDATRGAAMPIVTGVAPGAAADDAEVALYAHLDHPRPSANDNASGVVALVEVARMVTTRPARRHPVRFLWAPEFVGSAAWLHDVVGGQRAPGIAAVINLDTVGVSEALTGGALAIEQAPLDRPDVASAVLRLALRALPARHRTYAGTRAIPPLPWLPVPFVGASDHLVFADHDPTVSVTAASHHPDPMRHTSGDVADRVDLDRLRSVATAAAVAADLLADEVAGRAADGDTGPSPRATLVKAAVDAAIGENLAMALAAAAVAGRLAPDDGLVHPDDPARLDRRLAAIRAAGRRDLEWVDRWTGSGLDGSTMAAAPPSSPAPASASAGALRRAARGPFNLVGSLQAVARPVRDEAWRAIDRDRGGEYARLVSLALAADGTRTVDTVIEVAAFSCGLAIDPGWARRYLGGLRDAGWLTEAPGCT